MADVKNKRNDGATSDKERDLPQLTEIAISTASQAPNYIQDLRQFVES